MSKFRKMMTVATLLLASSSVFVACSDDEGTFGALPVNSVVVTGTTADVIWSIVPNDNCQGYEVTLYEGSRDGKVVETKKLDNRTCSVTFTNLTPATAYCVKTQAIPGKGYSGADPYYREFYTAPVMKVTADGFVLYTDTVEFTRDSLVIKPDSMVITTVTVIKDGIRYEKGDTVKFKSDTTKIKVLYDSVVSRCRATLSWPAAPSMLCGGYALTIYNCDVDSFKKYKCSIDSFPKGRKPKVIRNHTALKATSDIIEGLMPDSSYTVATSVVPTALCDFSAGDLSLIGFKTPAAKE